MSLADLVLTWMSARTSGSWAQFRSCIEDLQVDSTELTADDPEGGDLPCYQAFRLNLERMGHAEFFLDGRTDWRIAPPVIAMNSGQEGRIVGVVVGARSDSLLTRLASIATTRAIPVTTTWTDDYPMHVVLSGAGERQLAQLAATLGIGVQASAPAALLLSCAVISADSVARREIPFGKNWTVQLFSAHELRWTRSSVEEANASDFGLFQFSLPYERHVLLCAKGAARVVGKQTGKYLVLRAVRRRVLEYDAASMVLSCPAICRPPLLIERALILCSGLSPDITRTPIGLAMRYRAVAPQVAAIASRLLAQEVGWKARS